MPERPARATIPVVRLRRRRVDCEAPACRRERGVLPRSSWEADLTSFWSIATSLHLGTRDRRRTTELVPPPERVLLRAGSRSAVSRDTPFLGANGAVVVPKRVSDLLGDRRCSGDSREGLLATWTRRRPSNRERRGLGHSHRRPRGIPRGPPSGSCSTGGRWFRPARGLVQAPRGSSKHLAPSMSRAPSVVCAAPFSHIPA